MNKYISWGDINININDTSYVFITSFGEFIGMFIFLFFLCACICNFKLKSFQCKSNPTGWIVLAISLGLFIGLITCIGMQVGIFNAIYGKNNNFSYEELIVLTQSNLNPVFVIIGMIKGSNLSNGYIPFGNGIMYLLFELLGGICAGFIVSFLFKKQIKENNDFPILRSCYYTSPNIKNTSLNLSSEIFGTFILVISIIALNYFSNNNAILRNLIISIIVLGIGYAISNLTSYALNPFRDLSLRLVYFVLYRKIDIECKKDWLYSYVPILGPIIGGIIGLIMMPGFLY